MPWYAQRSWRAVRQVVSDAFILAWGIAWWFVGRWVHALIGMIAEPGRRAAAAAQRMSDSMSSAGDSVGSVPGVGDTLRHPFDEAAGAMADLVASVNGQVAAVERLASAAGWLTFLVPVLIMVALWLPVRLRFVRRARAARQFVDATADLDLFALRAMATQPLPVLARISDDPVAAWRSGDRAVIDRLAEVELRRSGLAMPGGGSSSAEPG